MRSVPRLLNFSALISSSTCEIALVVLWLAPIFWASGLVYFCGVNVFFYDDFAIGGFLNGVHQHGLQWADLIAQHNESRLVTLRLLALLSTAVHRHFDIRLLMWASMLTGAVTGWMVSRLARRSFGTGAAGWTVAITANGLLFLPSQWQNFLWGVQWIVFVPAAALAIGLVMLDRSVPLRTGLPIAIFAAAFSNYTNSNGFLVWGLLLPSLLVRRSAGRSWAVGSWIAAGSVSVGYYFHGYAHPDGHPPFQAIIENPIGSVKFLLAFLGNGLRCTESFDAAMRIGLVAVLLCGLACGIIVISRDPRLPRNSLPWMMLAMYSVMSGILATMGRVGFGPLWAIPPRYPTFALPLFIALVPLWMLAGRALRGRWRIGPKLAATPAVLVIGWIFVLSIHSSLFIRPELKHYHAARLTGLAMVQWLHVSSDEKTVTRALVPWYALARDTILQMEQNDLIPHDAFVNTDDMGAITNGTASTSAGQIDELSNQGDDWHIAGWAMLPGSHRAADAVLLTVRDPRGVDRVIAMTGNVHLPAHQPHQPDCRWECTLPRSRVPTGAVLSAWAYDALSMKAYRLADVRRE